MSDSICPDCRRPKAASAEDWEDAPSEVRFAQCAKGMTDCGYADDALIDCLVLHATRLEVLIKEAVAKARLIEDEQGRPRLLAERLSTLLKMLEGLA